MSIKNIFKNLSAGRTSPPSAHIAVTPSDTVDLEFVTQSLYVGGAGNVAVVSIDGDTVTYVSNGGYIIGEFTRVLSTGTTATNIIAAGRRA
ncbi:spike base protein, RCAP_Rcc01079 family [Methylosinus sp. LW4]|uniref:spike base protein, RCAP_Rcc01079 family n=1 Tax=Methylosinus sp. LW4 TaxID=136993 RepID=UPI0003760C71|nr:hypothetical protein [Methylosinus sp. LW4]